MTEPIDIYFSFRSPYSYLASARFAELEHDYDVALHLRPVLPLAVREPSFFSPENLKRARYIATDWVRRAQMKGMPHEWPNPDPIVQDFATAKVAEDQPYIYRLTYLGVEAERQGHGPAFATAVSHLIFGGTQHWDQGHHLANIAESLRLNFADMDSAIQNGDHADEVARNQITLESIGQWGVPTFALRGEPFFGDDRIDTLRWRLDQLGLKRG